MAKLLKNKDTKERVMSWLRASVALNMEKQKMYTQIPVASDGFILSVFSEYHQQFPKVNCLYLASD
jgi:Ubiquitin elongating factor core